VSRSDRATSATSQTQCPSAPAASANSNTYTHKPPFNDPLSGTTGMIRYQKGKTNLDFTEARDSEWQWHQLGHMQAAPRSRQITMPAPHHLVFYRLLPNQQCQSNEGNKIVYKWLKSHDNCNMRSGQRISTKGCIAGQCPQVAPSPAGHPGSYLTHGSLGPPKSTTKTASQSVQRF